MIQASCEVTPLGLFEETLNARASDRKPIALFLVRVRVYRYTPQCNTTGLLGIDERDCDHRAPVNALFGICFY